jgi:nucleoid-associated protein EbfC
MRPRPTLSKTRICNVPNFTDMMKQAAQLQSKMQALQAELDTITVEGAAGGGMVTVTLTVKGDLKALTIDASLLKAEEKEILEDLLIAAHADAAGKNEGGHRRPSAAAGIGAVMRFSEANSPLAAAYSPPPCGEGLGVGVEIDTGPRLTPTPLPSPPPEGGRERAVPRGGEPAATRCTTRI